MICLQLPDWKPFMKKKAHKKRQLKMKKTIAKATAATEEPPSRPRSAIRRRKNVLEPPDSGTNHHSSEDSDFEGEGIVVELVGDNLVISSAMGSSQKTDRETRKLMKLLEKSNLKLIDEQEAVMVRRFNSDDDSGRPKGREVFDEVDGRSFR